MKKFRLLHKKSKIFIAGHTGLVGSALVRYLHNLGFNNLILKTRNEVNLLDQNQVMNFFKKRKIDYVIMAAAKCGGIKDNNQYPVDYFYKNAQMSINVINSSFQEGVKKLLYLGSSCTYPKFSREPIKEEYLMGGHLEETNISYAIAKIAGIEFCRAIYRQYGLCFISAILTNLFGPGDNFNPYSSHVIPALIRKVHEAKKNGCDHIVIWGSGKPLRNFLYVDDLAEALITVLDRYQDIEPINVGHKDAISIKDLAIAVCNVLNCKIKIKCDTSMPDGTLSKKLLLNKMDSLGFKPKVNLLKGIENTYKWALKEGILN